MYFLRGREKGGGGERPSLESTGTMVHKCTLFENSIHSISDFSLLLWYEIELSDL